MALDKSSSSVFLTTTLSATPTLSPFGCGFWFWRATSFPAAAKIIEFPGGTNVSSVQIRPTDLRINVANVNSQRYALPTAETWVYVTIQQNTGGVDPVVKYNNVTQTKTGGASGDILAIANPTTTINIGDSESAIKVAELAIWSGSHPADATITHVYGDGNTCRERAMDGSPTWFWPLRDKLIDLGSNGDTLTESGGTATWEDEGSIFDILSNTGTNGVSVVSNKINTLARLINSNTAVIVMGDSLAQAGSSARLGESLRRALLPKISAFYEGDHSGGLVTRTSLVTGANEKGINAALNYEVQTGEYFGIPHGRRYNLASATGSDLLKYVIGPGDGLGVAPALFSGDDVIKARMIYYVPATEAERYSTVILKDSTTTRATVDLSSGVTGGQLAATEDVTLSTDVSGGRQLTVSFDGAIETTKLIVPYGCMVEKLNPTGLLYANLADSSWGSSGPGAGSAPDATTKQFSTDEWASFLTAIRSGIQRTPLFVFAYSTEVNGFQLSNFISRARTACSTAGWPLPYFLLLAMPMADADGGSNTLIENRTYAETEAKAMYDAAVADDHVIFYSFYQATNGVNSMNTLAPHNIDGATRRWLLDNGFDSFGYGSTAGLNVYDDGSVNGNLFEDDVHFTSDAAVDVFTVLLNNATPAWVAPTPPHLIPGLGMGIID